MEGRSHEADAPATASGDMLKGVRHEYLVSWSVPQATYSAALARFPETGAAPSPESARVRALAPREWQGSAVAQERRCRRLGDLWHVQWRDVLPIDVTPCVEDADVVQVLLFEAQAPSLSAVAAARRGLHGAEEGRAGRSFMSADETSSCPALASERSYLHPILAARCTCLDSGLAGNAGANAVLHRSL
jgi:hypothetical protein